MLRPRPLTVALNSYIGEYQIDWQHLLGGSVVATVPVIIMFAVIEGKVVGGPTAGPVKWQSRASSPNRSGSGCREDVAIRFRAFSAVLGCSRRCMQMRPLSRQLMRLLCTRRLAKDRA
jgi:hypothetical protein